MDLASDSLSQQAPQLESRVKTFLNQTLKDICKAEGLQISGVKAALQGRIITRLRELAESGDSAGFDTLRKRINDNAGGGPSSQSNNHQSNHANYAKPQGYFYPHADSYWSMDNAYRPYSNNAGYMPSNPGPRSAISFKSSPFERILEPLSGIVELPVMMSNRNTGTARFRISPQHTEQIRSNKTLRVMLYCCADPGTSQHPVDVAFPSQVEVKVNKMPYTASLRGLKKRPGTTRPADITEFCRLFSQPSDQEISVTYAATDKKFIFLAQLCRKYSAEELTTRVKTHNFISKNAVIDEMLSKAKDPEIEATSSVMSLKCPLSTIRMKLPCRSTICSHNQCFDALPFLQTQEQAPQWSCPICSKVFKFENLVVDKYVQDILESTPSSVDQVTVEPDGSWKQGNHVDEAPSKINGTSKRKHAEYLDDDDFLEMSDFQTKEQYGGVSLAPPSFNMTPTTSSREASTTGSSAPWSSNQKKTTSEVIDLTLDSDEEDEDPIRPPPIKRQSMGAGIQSSSHSLLPQNHQPYQSPQFAYLSYAQRPSQHLPQRPAPVSFGLPSKPGFDQHAGYLSPPHVPYNDWGWDR